MLPFELRKTLKNGKYNESQIHPVAQGGVLIKVKLERSLYCTCIFALLWVCEAANTDAQCTDFLKIWFRRLSVLYRLHNNTLADDNEGSIISSDTALSRAAGNILSSSCSTDFATLISKQNQIKPSKYFRTWRPGLPHRFKAMRNNQTDLENCTKFSYRFGKCFTGPTSVWEQHEWSCRRELWHCSERCWLSHRSRWLSASEPFPACFSSSFRCATQRK